MKKDARIDNVRKAREAIQKLMFPINKENILDVIECLRLSQDKFAILMGIDWPELSRQLKRGTMQITTIEKIVGVANAWLDNKYYTTDHKWAFKIEDFMEINEVN